MTNITFIAQDGTNKITIEKQELDYLPDVLDAFLGFLQAMGYTYVERLGVIQVGNKEMWTE
jgi:hypothetical protein